MPRAANQAVQEPGAEGEIGEGADTAAVVDKDARIAELEAKLAAQEAASKLPQVVFEPVTPHGAAAMAASDYAQITVAQLMGLIDNGKAKEPITSVLCSDGWYAKR